jgi:hypothetical protein
MRSRVKGGEGFSSLCSAEMFCYSILVAVIVMCLLRFRNEVSFYRRANKMESIDRIDFSVAWQTALHTLWLLFIQIIALVASVYICSSNAFLSEYFT